MGEVYRARDPKLRRDVALKILPAAFAADPERRARFTREAQVLAALNHPHIAAIYGVEEADASTDSTGSPLAGSRQAAVTALVLELVEGEDLSTLIARRSAGSEDPASIRTTPASTELANSPTMTATASRLGMIVGTAAYMSPEQAKGKPVDKRTDIWAFGCVLYELLTGRRAFAGEDVADFIAAVLTKEPDWALLPPAMPPRLVELLKRCLTKDVRERLRDIGDARQEINNAITNPATERDSSVAVRTPRRRRLAGVATWMVLGGLLGAAALAAWLFSLGVIPIRKIPQNAPVTRFSIPVPKGAASPQISPDGRLLAFVGLDVPRQIWVRPLDALEARPLPGTDDARNPFWSPDSRFLGFFAQGKLKKVDLTGGPPVTLCDAPEGLGGAWSRDDVIVFAPRSAGRIQKVSAAGGTPLPVTSLDKKAQRHGSAVFLPDGQHFVFWANTTAGGHAYLASLTSSEVTLLPAVTSPPAYASGALVFTRGSTLMRQPFDPARLESTGDPTPVSERVSEFSVSPTGVLVCTPAPAPLLRRLVWVDRRGTVTPLPLAAGDYGDPSLSPDGRQIALVRRDASGAQIHVWDIARATLQKRTFEGENWFPIWTPDGRYLTFTRGSEYIGPLMRLPADGSGQAVPLVTDEQRGGEKVAISWSPDGRLLAFQNNQDVIVRDADGVLHPALATPAFEREGRFAPRGRWLAYRSNETGRDEVYVQSYPAGGGKWQISTDGGAQPMWGSGGRELFYKSGNRLMVSAVEAGETFKPGTPRMLFEMSQPERDLGDPSRYGVTPDGQRFLVVTTGQGEAGAGSPQIIVVQNWLQQLKPFVPTK